MKQKTKEKMQQTWKMMERSRNTGMVWSHKKRNTEQKRNAPPNEIIIRAPYETESANISVVTPPNYFPGFQLVLSEARFIFFGVFLEETKKTLYNECVQPTGN